MKRYKSSYSFKMRVFSALTLLCSLPALLGAQDFINDQIQQSNQETAQAEVEYQAFKAGVFDYIRVELLPAALLLVEKAEEGVEISDEELEALALKCDKTKMALLDVISDTQDQVEEEGDPNLILENKIQVINGALTQLRQLENVLPGLQSANQTEREQASAFVLSISSEVFQDFQQLNTIQNSLDSSYSAESGSTLLALSRPVLNAAVSEYTQNTISGDPQDSDVEVDSNLTSDKQAIQDLATELKTPVKVFEYFRNNFVHELYFGARKSTAQVLRQKAANDADMASAMISVLRALGVPARYAYGTTRLSDVDLANWLGVHDSQLALVLAENHIPYQKLTTGDYLIDRVWVLAYIDYFPYRGATPVDASLTLIERGDTWVAMDPAFKKHHYSQRRDIASDLSMNTQSFLTNTEQQSTLAPLLGHHTIANSTPFPTKDNVTALPQTFILNDVIGLGNRLAEYMNQNQLMLDTVFQEKLISEELYGLIPTTDFYQVHAYGPHFSHLPQDLQSTISLELLDAAGKPSATIELPAAQALDSSIDITWIPASQEDSDILAELEELENGKIDSYQANVYARILLNGQTYADSAESIPVGSIRKLVCSINEAGANFDDADAALTFKRDIQLTAGSLSTFVTTFGQEQNLEHFLAQLQVNQNLPSFMRASALNYFHQSQKFAQLNSASLGLSARRELSLIQVNLGMDVENIFGQPFTAKLGAMEFNTIRDAWALSPLNEQTAINAEENFTLTQSLTSSVLASNGLKQMSGTQAYSAPRLFQLASESAIPILTIRSSGTATQETFDALDLTLDAITRDYLLQALNKGKQVSVTRDPISLSGAQYTPIFILDTSTGDAQFMHFSPLQNLSQLSQASLPLDASYKLKDILLGSRALPKELHDFALNWMAGIADASFSMGVAYLPAILYANNYFTPATPSVENKVQVDSLSLTTAAISFIGRIDEISSRPALININLPSAYLSPNDDGNNDFFTMQGGSPRSSSWNLRVTDSQGQEVRILSQDDNQTPDTSNPDQINLDWDLKDSSGSLLVDGPYSYKMTAFGEGSGASTFSGDFTVDNTAPQAELQVIQEQVNGQTLTRLTGTADDANLYFWQLEILDTEGQPVLAPYDGMSAIINNGFGLLDSSLLANGTYSARLSVMDQANNLSIVTQSESITINNPAVDNTPPNLSANSPVFTPNQLLSGQIPLKVKAFDSSGITLIEVKLDGQVIHSVNNSELDTFIDSANIAEGPHKLDIRAVDGSGLESQLDQASFITSQLAQDTIAPQVSFSISSATNPAQDALTYSITAKDNIAVAYLQILVDGQSHKTIQDPAQTENGVLDISNLSPGSHTLAVLAVDSSGNRSLSQPLNFESASTKEDTVAPSLQLSLAQNSTGIYVGSLAMQATATDASGIKLLELYVGEQLIKSLDSPLPASFAHVLDLTIFADGIHTLKLLSTDNFGNTSELTKDIEVSATAPDTTSPSLALTYPSTSSAWSGTIKVKATAQDNVGVKLLKILVNDATLTQLQDPQPAELIQALDTTKLEDGTHTFQVVASDEAGNSSSTAKITFTVDQSADQLAPQFSLTWAGFNFDSRNPQKSHRLEQTQSDNSLLTISAWDNVDVNEIRVLIDGINIVSKRGESLTEFIDLQSLADGAHSLTVEIQDQAGNINSDFRLFFDVKTDFEAPTISLDHDVEDLLNPVKGNINLAMTAKDNKNLSHVELILNGQVFSTLPFESATELVNQDNTLSYLFSTLFNTGDLDDANHSLKARAYDLAGNFADSANLNFSTYNPVANFKVSPDYVDPNVAAQITASANFKKEQNWTLTFTGDDAPAAISGSGSNLNEIIPVTGLQDGNYSVTLSVEGIQEDFTKDFTINLLTGPPVATVTNIPNNLRIREGFFDLKGTANDPDAEDAVSYRVIIYDREGNEISNATPYPRNDQGWFEGRVTSGDLGKVDLTLLRNGAYALQLQVKGGPNSIYSTKYPFFLESALKIGQFGFSQQDLILPVAGLPLSVIRTYNSLNPKKGDFGYGWTWSITDIEMELSENRGFVQNADGDNINVRTGGDRNVTITLPDGRRTTFEFSYEERGSFFKYYFAKFTAAPGVYATLRTTTEEQFVALPGGLQYWQGGGPSTDNESYEFGSYTLTMKDGTQYRIDRPKENEDYILYDDGTSGTVITRGDATLKQITDRNGNKVEFNDSSIDHYNASGEKTKSIDFVRNTKGLVSAIYDPNAQESAGNAGGSPASYTYEYDSNDRLIAVNQLVTAGTAPDGSDSIYRTTRYKYDNASFPNYITEIVDPRGISPMKTEYDASGRIIATIDASGNRIVMDHNLVDKSETIYDRLGNPTIHNYDNRGNVLSTIDSQGNKTVRTYDSLNNELTVTDALGNKTVMTYDSKGNQRTITDPLGNVTTFTYDANGNQLTTTDALGNKTTNKYSGSNLVNSTNALGQKTTNKYDGNGNLQSTLDALDNVTATFGYNGSNLTSLTDASGIIRGFSYDGNGDQTGSAFTWKNPKDPSDVREVRTKTIYDGARQVIKTIDPQGNESTTKYNDFGKPFETVDSLGNKTVTIYDYRGNVIETQYPDGTVTRTFYDKAGRAVASTDRHLASALKVRGSRTVYNSIGQVARSERLDDIKIVIQAKVVNSINTFESVVVSTGSVISSSSTIYDKAGRVAESTNADGQKTRFEYDKAGRQVAVVDALGNRSKNEYDKLGRRVKAIDALKRETVFEYDVLSRLVKTIYPDATFTSTAYNTLGQRVSETDQTGKVKKFEYDIQGRLIAVELPEVLNPETNVRVKPKYIYDYNVYGNLDSITDPKGRITSFTYDQFGRQLSRKMPSANTESKVYDTLGRMKYAVDFKGQIMGYSYDNLGRTTDKKYYANLNAYNSDLVDKTVSMEYDELGRVDNMTDERGITDYTYSIDGRLMAIASPEGTLNYEYYEATGRKKRTYTQNSDQRYVYDELGRLEVVAVHKKNGVTLTTPEETIYVYNELGLREGIIYSNGVMSTYDYNSMNQLTDIAHITSAEEVLASYKYELRADGRRAEVLEKRKEASGVLSQTSIVYTYDELNRLTKEASISNADDATFITNYEYDIVGNRTKKASASDVIDYSYNISDQLVTEASTAEGTTSYGYDVTGAMVSKTRGLERSTFEYGYDNRMEKAQIKRYEDDKFVESNVEYVYNQNGTRVRTRNAYSVDGSSAGDDEHLQLVDEANFTGYSQVFEEYKDGALSTSYVIGDDVLAQSKGGIDSHLLYDGHGSTRLITGNDAGIQERYSFDAYGMMLGGNSGLTNGTQTSLLYSGEMYDNALQQQYLRARYYDQNTASFNRLDPFAGDELEPQSFNKYGYVHGDPVNAIDPSGLFSIAEFGATTGGMAILSGVFAGTITGVLGVMNGLSANQIITEVAISFGAGMLAVLFAPVGIALLALGLTQIALQIGNTDFAGRGGFNIAVGIVVAILVLAFLRVRGKTLMPNSGSAPSSNSTSLQKFYPDNNGFTGKISEKFLYKGDTINRYGGSDYSRFFSPKGIKDFERALPPGVGAQKLRTFEVLKPFPVQSGRVAPAFNELGGGTQFVTPLNLKALVDKGILKEVIK
ncbi:Ig-like domain-containing protein [Lentisphaera profundi]|uniref:Ig-like domain-containing protein n=1 Tax=Lentisphaera profundi TaxID=1658616 RepID=A0ABY7VUC5_9BACT|nr:Ig-like domain-containing protein [Lentisphaera profundi]WDE97667.1 Ig-like domain-containing protein [Lentisphaera profundi]